jgi:hypothetical protein
MNGPSTDAIGAHDLMKLECVAHLAVAATFLATAEYTPVNCNPAQMAIHVVNEAMRDGKLGLMHTCLTRKLR